ncbi:Nascent polypeptide-associated complex subunit beta [Hondaea fermentalgiana]|uniref:Nascent polypeptide-associated complex subunit beta n=1 Tax=Hondaea fermentalgiana TaxID=2315210 RepID=A0A2R5GH08_9STRA|nr:Nascent polypeptide-associated complex subunit beta [Hondaea fermentalgiana]|eukprot:GBG30160.1 Nascent polypeptide-associated complex subunit beta [Hondaea fermentalgiana]
MGEDAEILAARERLKNRFGGNAQSKLGGRGTVRRKKKAVNKSSAGADDRKLQSSLKRLGVNPIQGISEVNMFCDDQTVIRFKNPKVQASIQANTFVIAGPNATANLADVVDEVGPMMGQANAQKMASMPGFYGQFNQALSGKEGAEGADAAEGDDEIPDLVDSFEEVAESEESS